MILAFGCPPSRYTAASSTLAKDFFRFLVDDADSKGYIALPGNLNFFHTEDKKNETLIKVSQPVLLQLKTPLIEGRSGEQASEKLAVLINELDGN